MKSTFQFRQRLQLVIAVGCLPALAWGQGLDLEKAVEQLGSSAFGERQAARNALRKQLSERPLEVAPALQAHLKKAKDPEIRISLADMLRGVLPVADFSFDEASFKAGEWNLESSIEGAKPAFLDDGSVEIDTRKKAKDSFIFKHPLPANNARHRTVMEGKVKVVELGPGTYCAILSVDDDVHSENLVIHADGFSTYNHKAPPVKLDLVGAWHTFRIEAERNTFRVFVDGADRPALTVPWTRHATALPSRMVRFGEPGSIGRSLVQYRDIQVTVYELD